MLDLPHAQLHAADLDGPEVPEVQRRGRDRTEDETEKIFLRLFALSRMRLRFVGQAGDPGMRELQEPVPRAEEFEEKRGLLEVSELQRGICS